MAVLNLKNKQTKKAHVYSSSHHFTRTTLYFGRIIFQPLPICISFSSDLTLGAILHAVSIGMFSYNI